MGMIATDDGAGRLKRRLQERKPNRFTSAASPRACSKACEGMPVNNLGRMQSLSQMPM